MTKDIKKKRINSLNPESLGKNGHDSPFPQLYSVQALANTFLVSVHCVRKWVKEGKLHPRCHRVSGRAVRYLFTTQDVVRFFEENFPTAIDLGKANDPRTSMTKLDEKICAMRALYHRRRVGRNRVYESRHHLRIRE